MFQTQSFGPNSLWNLTESEEPVAVSDFEIVSISPTSLTLTLPRINIFSTVTGNFSYAGASPGLTDVTGTIHTRSYSLGDLLLGTESFGDGADFKSILDFSYELSLLSGDDYFEGSLSQNVDDHIQALSGNDRFKGNGGGDYFFGGDGIDTSIYRGTLSEYVVSADNAIWDGRSDDGTRVSGYSVEDQVVDRDGKDYLNEVERLQFSDKSLALDVGATQNAGKAKLFIGAIAHSLANDAVTLGTILNFIDNGYSDLTSLSKLAIDVGLISTLAGGSSNKALVELVTTNLLGQANVVVEGMLLGYMNGTIASFSQAQFLGAVAALDINQQRVNLVGLAETGMEYVPLGL